MKHPKQIGMVAALLVAFFPSHLIAQYSDPAGFYTIHINGTGGVASFQDTLLGMPFTQPIEYDGIADDADADTLVDEDADWADDEFNDSNGAYYLEVTSGAGIGKRYDILDTVASTGTLTVTGTLPTDTPYRFKIRKHWTIASIFGPNNEGGLQAGTSSTADQVLLYNGTSYDTYFYSTGGLPGVGWRKNGAGTPDQAGTVIGPEDGILIVRKQSPDVNLLSFGTVKTGQTITSVLNGTNLLGNVYASGMTMASSGLASSGLASGNSTTADTIQIYNGSTWDTYFISSGGLIGAGWRKVGSSPANQDQSGTSILTASSMIITRKASGGFDWVAPQHPSSLIPSSDPPAPIVSSPDPLDYTVSWFGETDYVYRLQSSVDLESWSSLGLPFIGANAQLSFDEEEIGDDHKFYRIRRSIPLELGNVTIPDTGNGCDDGEFCFDLPADPLGSSTVTWNQAAGPGAGDWVIELEEGGPYYLGHNPGFAAFSSGSPRKAYICVAGTYYFERFTDDELYESKKFVVSHDEEDENINFAFGVAIAAAMDPESLFWEVGYDSCAAVFVDPYYSCETPAPPFIDFRERAESGTTHTFGVIADALDICQIWARFTIPPYTKFEVAGPGYGDASDPQNLVFDIVTTTGADFTYADISETNIPNGSQYYFRLTRVP